MLSSGPTKIHIGTHSKVCFEDSIFISTLGKILPVRMPAENNSLFPSPSKISFKILSTDKT